MNKLDVLMLLVIVYGISRTFYIKKEYKEYKKSKGLLDLTVLVRNIGAIFASIVFIIYKLFNF